jgi:hypothetical protein
MPDGQYSSSQKPSTHPAQTDQTQKNSPCPEPQEPKDPCDDPSSGPRPTLPCPDTKPRPCPEPKPCPEPPKWKCPPPKPDPCAQDDDCDEKEDDDAPPPPKGDCCKPPEACAPSDQLPALQQLLQQEQRQVEQLERVKTSITDLTARIQGLQTVMDGQEALFTAHRDFYRGIEVFRSEVECFIPTVRCQFKLTPEETQCLDEEIAKVDGQIAQAKTDYEDQQKRVDRYQAKWQRAAWELAYAKKRFDFFTTDLKDQIGKKKDDIGTLKPLADPTKNRCEAEFYLREMEELLRTKYCGDDVGPCCYPPSEPSIGTFLDCWSDKCFATAYNRAVVYFNNTEWVEKCRKTLLDAANTRLTELETAWKTAVEKRRETILAGIRSRPCCANGNRA